jgi:TM2 domain-containing membrane protein YozV
MSEEHQYLVPPGKVLHDEREIDKTVLVVAEGLGLGLLGIDHMYAGNWGAGVLKLMTGGGMGVWWLIDYVRVMANALSRSERGVLGVDRWRDPRMSTPALLAVVLIIADIIVLIVLVVLIIAFHESSPVEY